MGRRVSKTYNKDGSITKRTTYTRKTIFGNRKSETFVERIPAKKRKGCYVATSVYGSYDCPEVWTLRRYRDFVLLKSFGGKLFVHIYYFISPTLVRILGNNSAFNSIMHKFLDPFVERLNARGISNQKYNDAP